jgi:hypothetical protein
MNISKIITLAIAGLVSISIMLMVVQLLILKLKPKSETDGKIKLSYGIWFSSLFISASIVISKAILVFNEALDNIYKFNAQNTILESAKIASFYIGSAMVWFVAWVYIASFLTKMICGKRINANEIEADNYAYFLIRGMILIGLLLCLIPVFEIMIRLFIPSIEIPFYH